MTTVLRQIASARLMTRGTHARVPFVRGDVKPGEAVLHNHPNGDLGLSDADFEAMQQSAPLGIEVWHRERHGHLRVPGARADAAVRFQREAE